MSTKIYDAYKCPKFKTIDEFHTTVIEIRKKINNELTEITKKRVAIEWCQYFDNHKLGNLKGKVMNYQQFVTDVVNKYEKAGTSLQILDWDYTFKAMFFPHKGEIYMKLFVNNHRQLVSYFLAKGWVDFHYQNQTDKPDDVTEKDWNNRIKIWDEILGEGVWNEHGFEYDFSPNQYSIRFELQFKRIEKYIPTLQKRAKHQAEIQVLTISGIKEWNKAGTYLKTKKGQEELKKEAIKFEKTLGMLDVIEEI